MTLGGLAVGLGHPMSAMQFLWINLVSDVAPALALAVEPPERDLMAQPPRDPAAPILSGPVLRGIAAEGGVMAGATLGAYALALARHGPSPQAATVAFSTLAGSQLLHALAHRARTAGSPFRPSPLVGVVGASLAVQAAAPRVPFLRGLLGLAPLSLADWALVAGGALIPFLLTEFSRRRGGSDGSVRHGQQVIQEDQQITEGGQHGQADARDVKGRRRNGARSRRGFGDGWPPKGAGRRARVLQTAINSGEIISVGLVNLVRNTLLTGLTGARDVGAELGTTAVAAVRGSIRAGAEIGGDLSDLAKQAIRGTIMAADEIGGDLGSVAESAARGAVKASADVGGDVAKIARQAVEGTVEAAREIGADVGELAVTAAEGAVEAVDRIGSAAGRAVRTTLSGTVAGVRSILLGEAPGPAPARRAAASPRQAEPAPEGRSARPRPAARRADAPVPSMR